MTHRVKRMAEKATFGSFLNCYLREFGHVEWLHEGDSYVRIPLEHMHMNVKVSYRSPTGRHLFDFPAYLQVGANYPEPVDLVTAIVLLVRELSRKCGNDKECSSELIQRVLQSCDSIESYIRFRMHDAASLYSRDNDFIQDEQSLIFGHLNHPTPKSRQGFVEWHHVHYAPELQGQFQLHYFQAHLSLVHEDSALDMPAVSLIKSELYRDSTISQHFKETYCDNQDYAIIPVHPNQAGWLLSQPNVHNWMEQGLLVDLGLQGRLYRPTSSLRTVYHSEAEFMLKLSLQVKITNSVRVNKRKELVGGVEGTRLFRDLLPAFSSRYPQFRCIGDPAYLTLGEKGTEKESGFELILRDNPFQGEAAKQVTLIAGLVQDPLPGYRSRLSTIIHDLAQKEGLSNSQMSLVWFRKYMAISLEPMIWLYLTYGIALEAHQQNCLVELKDGYPSTLFFRDNQGYYYSRSTKPQLDNLLPGIGEKSGNIYDDAIVDERFRYYLIVNHMLGLINGFGTAGLIDERLLLAELRSVLVSFLPMNREPSQFLHQLLTDEQISCKANLLTRLYDMDELDSPMEQAVYVKMDNPLVTELPSMQVIYKAKQVTFHWRREAMLKGSENA